MREILFKGKRKDGIWFEGNLHKHKIETPSKTKNYYSIQVFNSGYSDDDLINQEYMSGFDEEVIPETIGQFTGLTDKNGKKIFEGDIVLFEDESPTNYEYHDCTEMRCGEIKFGDGQFYITNRIAVEMQDLLYDEKLDCEVIGNIYDNPELLGE